MSEDRGLTWSKKWHVIASSHVNPYGDDYVLSVCGAIIYETSDPNLPAHLKRVLQGKAKDTGLCKKCFKDEKPTATVELPDQQSDDYRDLFWPVPLYNPYNDVVGEPKTMYVGNVWFDRSGKIVTTSVPDSLLTGDDARRYAAALLAAADEWDKRQEANAKTLT